MAVYRHSYGVYDGPTTDPRLRFLVVARAGLKRAFRSRAFVVFYTLCLVPSLIAVAVVYARHNVSLLETLGLGGEVLDPLTRTFFAVVFGWQASLAFFTVAIVGPALVAPDLANNGLALYLGRPLSRTGYVLGKLAVLVGLASPITWIPGLLLWAVHAAYAGEGWWRSNLDVLQAFVLGHWAWLLVIGLLALAISAWVKWRPVAIATMFGIFFVLGGMSQTLQQLLDSEWPTVINLGEVITIVVATRFFPQEPTPIPVAVAWAALGGFALLSLTLLWRRIRPWEIVR